MKQKKKTRTFEHRGEAWRVLAQQMSCFVLRRQNIFLIKLQIVK